MSAPQRLTQVKLVRAVGPAAGIKYDIVWIDSKLAKKGTRVRDLNLEADGLSASGSIWTVEEVYGTKDFVDVEKQYAIWKRWADVLS